MINRLRKIILAIEASPERVPHSLRLPVTFAVAYIIIIFLFAILYRISGLEVTTPLNEVRDANIFDCVYFSVVTVTTLGYGDISPSGFFQKTLVVFETLMGVFAFGLFLTAIGYELSNRQTQIEKDNVESRRELYLAGFYRKVSEHISAFLNVFNHAERGKKNSETYVFKDMHALEVGRFLFDEEAVTRQTAGMLANNPGMSPNTTADVFFKSAGTLKDKLIEELDRYRLSIDDVSEIRRTEELIDYLNRIRHTVNYGGIEISGRLELRDDDRWVSLMRDMNSVYCDVIRTRSRYLSHSEKLMEKNDHVYEHETETIKKNSFLLRLREYLKI